jgi:hypothetical protein
MTAKMAFMEAQMNSWTLQNDEIRQENQTIKQENQWLKAKIDKKRQDPKSSLLPPEPMDQQTTTLSNLPAEDHARIGHHAVALGTSG